MEAATICAAPRSENPSRSKPRPPMHLRSSRTSRDAKRANAGFMGHCRGVEGAARAAFFNTLSHYPDDANIRFNYHYPIKSIVAIAPADGQYKPAGRWRTIENVNYFTIQGANDADVSSFM